MGNEPKSLEKLLVALQKEISRVNSATAENIRTNTEQPTATMCLSNVTFQLKFNSNLENDKIIIDKDGAVQIELSSEIIPDIERNSEGEK